MHAIVVIQHFFHERVDQLNCEELGGFANKNLSPQECDLLILLQRLLAIDWGIRFRLDPSIRIFGQINKYTKSLHSKCSIQSSLKVQYIA